MARARNMQVLTDQTKAMHPGVVIYGIGDEDHQGSPSGHNEDDTPGSRPDQTDADNNPEHRAIDAMLGPAFSRPQAWSWVTKLVTRPANQRRLTYVIFDGWIWSRNNTPAWAGRPFLKDPHRDHPHVNGLAANDEDGSPWDLDDAAPPAPTMEDDMALPLVFHYTTGAETAYALVFGPGQVTYVSATDETNDAGEYELVSKIVSLTGQKNTSGANASEGLSGPAWQALINAFGAPEG